MTITFNRLIAISLLIIVTITAATIYLSTLLKTNAELPFHTWKPYTIESKLAFWLTSLHQIIICFMLAFFICAFQTLTLMMVLNICAQIDLIVERLYMLPKLRKNGVSEQIVYQREAEIIKDCVHHHIHLYK